MTTAARWSAARRSLGTAVKRIVGMPDYHAYLEHLRTCHPACPPPSEREYFEEYLKQRYAGGGTRCC